MKVQVKKNQGALIVEVDEKRLDASIEAELKAFFKELAADDAGLVILDLSEVVFMDTSGLGAIVSGLKQFGPTREMAVAGAGESVAELFRLTRLDEVFALYPSQDEALNALWA